MLLRKLKYAVFLVFLPALSCQKVSTDVPQTPQRELSIPERLEEELLDLAGRGWDSLLSSLLYFEENFLSKGQYKGWGDDGVYYELKFSRDAADSLLYLNFCMDDSVHIAARGYFRPPGLDVYACDTYMNAQLAAKDSVSLEVEDIGVTLPFNFARDSLAKAPLRFEGSRVGYLTLGEFEDENYRTDKYIVVHYDNDSRTFAFNDIPSF